MATTGAVLVDRRASLSAHEPKNDSGEDTTPDHDLPRQKVANVSNGHKSQPEPEQHVEEEDDDEHHAWETSSLLEDILDEVEPSDFRSGPDICTPAETRAFRDRLHEVGAGPFIFETITAGTITAKKLCTAFGVHPPAFLEAYPDAAYYQILGHAIARELGKRRRLPQYKTIDDAARLLKEAKNVIVITGAGISTSLGIPDFRSKHTGFYSKLQEAGFDEPEQVFDLRAFDEDPTAFYKLAGDILPDLNKWSPTHEFIHLLQQKDKLLTNYTQNIDNLEQHTGIKPEKLIQCHGSWATATCRKCGWKIPGEDIFEDLRQKRISECKACIEKLKEGPRPGAKRKRSSNGASKKRKPGSLEDDDDSDGAFDIPQPGVMKPDITFFGEPLPSGFFDRIQDHDREKVDLVIVMGTSMKVAPVSEVPQIIPPEIPQIYISRDPIHHIEFDINLLGDCDVVVGELCRRAGWELKHKMLNSDQKVNVEQVEDQAYMHTVKVKDNGVKVEANGA